MKIEVRLFRFIIIFVCNMFLNVFLCSLIVFVQGDDIGAALNRIHRANSLASMNPGLASIAAQSVDGVVDNAFDLIGRDSFNNELDDDDDDDDEQPPMIGNNPPIERLGVNMIPSVPEVEDLRAEVVVKSKEPIPIGHEEAKKKGCNMIPPYIYVTFHSGGNIAKYTRDGCYLSNDTLYTQPDRIPERDVEFRSMIIGPYKSYTNSMYIANGARRGSQILVYGPCGMKSPDTPYKYNPITKEKINIKSHQRDIFHVLTAKHQPSKTGNEKLFHGKYKGNRGANHCFGIALDLPYNNVTHTDTNIDIKINNNIYSNQYTNIKLKHRRRFHPVQYGKYKYK